MNNQNNPGYLEQVPLATIAREVGTPCYVYSQKILTENWQAFEDAFQSYPHHIYYAVKACSNLAILNILAKLGSGFDIVSEGELERVLKAGGDPKKIVFSGVGKTESELIRALQVGVGCINIESEAELIRLNIIALTLNKKAVVAIRVNPDVDAKTHPFISTGLENNKFGVNFEEALRLCRNAKQYGGIEINGLAFHIGSQLTTLNPFIEALQKTLLFIANLKKENIFIQALSIGGGLGVCYQSEKIPTPREYADAILTLMKPTGLTLKLEPGRAIVANAGVLLTKVEYLKKQTGNDKYFAIVDAGMNDLIRPALYDAWQNIQPLRIRPEIKTNLYDIVGPVCETADCLGKDRSLSIEAGDYLMICTTGAYGFSMSSHYNSRPRVAEVLVHEDAFQVIRVRETLADLWKGEMISEI